MITFGSFLHRKQFNEFIGRWLSHDFGAEDPTFLKKWVNYNSIFIRSARNLFAQQLLPQLYGNQVEPIPVATKGDYKDLLVQSFSSYDVANVERVQDRIAAYLEYPEEYYRETPFEGIAYKHPQKGMLVATSRIKRVRRISEKCSRRIIDHVFDRIKQEANELARVRATALGIPFSQLITPDEKQYQEFIQAEQRVIRDIRNGVLLESDPVLPINDVLGFKLISDDTHNLEEWIVSRGDLELIEREPHTGQYNATNYIIRWHFPLEIISKVEISGVFLEALKLRGIDNDVVKDYIRFVGDSEQFIDLEIIHQNYEEAVESEIGRCMHETRIIQQRYEQAYRGPAAKNIRMLTQFLFYFALSKRQRLKCIPIKLWVQYMPDYYEQVFNSLKDFPAGRMGLAP